MNIFKAMRPAGVYPSVMDMPWDKLKGEGIDVALLDFDNTLGPDRAHEPDEYSFKCIRMLQDLGISPCLVSNAKSSRSEGIARILDIPCVIFPSHTGNASFSVPFKSVSEAEGNIRIFVCPCYEELLLSHIQKCGKLLSSV